MELHDIENWFISILKSYKSGKFYLFRSNVYTVLGKPQLKIYDEQEQIIPIEDINDSHKVISIIEIKGIKCSATSFQVETEIKQMLVLNDTNIFDTCLIKNYHHSSIENKDTIEPINTVTDTKTEPPINVDTETIETKTEPPINIDTETIETKTEPPIIIDTETIETKTEPPINVVTKTNTIDIQTQNNSDCLLDNDNEIKNIDMDDEMQHNNIIENEPYNINLAKTENNGIQEIDLTLDQISNEDNFTIRNKKAVYYEMYKKAKQKARAARDLATTAYLETMRIKNLYMLDSDDENLSDEETECDDYEN